MENINEKKLENSIFFNPRFPIYLKHNLELSMVNLLWLNIQKRDTKIKKVRRSKINKRCLLDQVLNKLPV